MLRDMLRHLKLNMEIKLDTINWWWEAIKKCKTIWIKIEYLKDIELNALRVCDYRYIKTKIRTYGDNVPTNFPSLNVPEDNIEFESFRVISIESLLVYQSKCYLQVYLNNYAYKIIVKQMTDYYDDNLLEHKIL